MPGFYVKVHRDFYIETLHILYVLSVIYLLIVLCFTFAYDIISSKNILDTSNIEQGAE